jgi:3-methyladenine DNA glycosylase Tag
MTKPSEDLDKVFDIDPIEEEVEVKPTEILKKKAKPIVISDKGEDKEKDYQYARAQLYDIVEKMQESLDSAMEVAQESEHPRAFEVVFNGAKNAADVVEKIGDLHKKMRDLETAEESKVQQNNTQNNVFVAGTTEELMKMLKSSGGINTNPLTKKDK